MRIRFYSVTVFVFLLLGLFFLICDVPTPPPGADQADVKLILRSTTGQVSTSSIKDTVGKFDTIGVVLELTQYIDSAEIFVSKGDSIEFHFKTDTKKVSVDTVYYTVMFPTAGDRTVTAKGYINGAENVEATAVIHIIDNPQANTAPELTVSGWDLVTAGDTVTLSVTATDADAGQSLTIDATCLPEGATFENDTLLWVTTLEDTGIDTAIFIAQDNGDPVMADTDTVVITVSADPVNRPPVLSITGRHTITVGDTMVLSITATDPDSGQTVTIEAPRLPDGATFENDTIRWIPGEEDIGSDTAAVTATDNGDPVRSAEETVAILVTETPVNESPDWNTDTLRLSAETGKTCSRLLSDLCSDPDGDAISWTLLSGEPGGDAVDEATWSFTPSESDVGVHTIRIVASDPFEGADTIILILTVESADEEDLVSPVIARVTPAADSQTTSASRYEVTVSCSDPSGIAEVLCSMDEADFEVTSSADTLYSATVTGLQPSLWNTVRFIGIDNAPAANRCTLFVSLMYDPESPDENPPSITLISPSNDTTVGEDNCVVRAECTDQSGIAQVTIGGEEAQEEGDGIFSATVTGLAAGKHTTVTVIATDAATASNTDSVSVRIYCDDDATGPEISLVTPDEDSIATNAESYTVTLSCTDASGVAAVSGEMDGTTFTGARGSGENWDITIEGLAEGAYSTVVFTATDSSLRANTSGQTLYIMYDPTIDDGDGPTITQQSGPESGEVISDAVVTIVDTVYDPSEIESVTWTINGGTAQDMESITGTPGLYSLSTTLPDAGAYTIVVTAVDNSSQHNASPQTIELEYVIAPEITDQSESDGYCTGEEVRVSVTATGTEPLEYQWRDEDGDISDANESEYIISSLTENTTLTCVVSNAAAESATSDPIVITMNILPSDPIIDDPDAICPGESVDLTSCVTNTPGNGGSWIWYDSARTSALTSTTVSPNSNTTYWVHSEGGTCGESDWASVTVTINQTAGTPVGSATPSSVCPGDEVVVGVTSGEPGTGGAWVWYASDKTTKVANPFTPTATADYYVRSEGSACGVGEWSSAVTVTVKTKSTNPTAISISRETPICSGSSITLSVTGGSLGTNARWYWYTNSSYVNSFANGTSRTQSVEPSDTTTYYVRAEGDCNITTATVSRKIDVYPEPSVSAPDGYKTGCDERVEFSVVASGSYDYTYQWQESFDGGSTFTDIYLYDNYNQGNTTPTLSIVPLPNLDKWVRCLVTDGCGTTVISGKGHFVTDCE